MKIAIDSEDLRPLVEQVVEATLKKLAENKSALGADDRMAFSEAEAARMLGMNSHQLRDERLRGRVTGSITSGRRVKYTRADLDAYLAARRVSGPVA